MKAKKDLIGAVGDEVRSIRRELILINLALIALGILMMVFPGQSTAIICRCIGAVLVPLDRDWQQEDLADTVQKAGVSFLFGEEEISDKLSFIAEQTELSEAPILLASKNSERSLSSLLNGCIFPLAT